MDVRSRVWDFTAVDDGAKPDQVILCVLLGREPCAIGFQEDQELNELIGLELPENDGIGDGVAQLPGQRPLVHETSAFGPRRRGDQASGGEGPQRLPHGGSADREDPRQFGLARQAIPLLELTGEDGFAQLALDLFTWPEHLARPKARFCLILGRHARCGFAHDGTLSNSNIVTNRECCTIPTWLTLDPHAAVFGLMINSRLDLGWAVIGTGWMAQEVMIPAIRSVQGQRVVALHGSSAARTAEIGARLRIPLTSNRLVDVLSDPTVDAVYIGTYNNAHHALSMAAAAAGKHVLCEKPMALSLRQATEVLDACRSHGVTFSVNHYHRHKAIFRQAKQLLDDGAIGDVVAGHVSLTVRLPEHLRRWRMHDPLSGGVTKDQTGHLVDLLRFLLGKEVSSVMATASETESSHGVEDTMSGILEFDRGPLVSITNSYVVESGSNTVELNGTRGSLVVAGSTSFAVDGQLELRGPDGNSLVDIQPAPTHYARVVELFSSAVASGRGVDPRDGLRSLEASLALLRAAATGARVRLSVSV